MVSTTKPCVGCEVRNGGFFDGVVILITDPGKIDPGFVLGTALNKLAGEDRQGGPLDDLITLNMSMHVQLAEDDLNTAHLNNNAHEPGGGLTASFSMSWSSKSMGQQQADQIRWVLWGRHPLWERSHAFPDFSKEIPKEKQPIRFFGVARWSIAQLNNEVHDRGDWHIILRNHAGLISFLKQYKLIGILKKLQMRRSEPYNPCGQTLCASLRAEYCMCDLGQLPQPDQPAFQWWGSFSRKSCDSFRDRDPTHVHVFCAELEHSSTLTAHSTNFLSLRDF